MSDSQQEAHWVTEEHKKMLRYGFKIKEKLYSARSAFQKIDIVDTEFYGRMLLLDDAVMTTEHDEFIYHEMISHIPLLSYAKKATGPESVLIIGGGDGGVVREVLKHPTIQEIVLCEIDGMVIEASKKHLPSIAGWLKDPRVDIHVRDGIEFITEHKNRFDVILVDSTDPVGPGEGLFTESFYRDVQSALTPGGVMVNQSESPVGNTREIALVYHLLRKVFPLVVPYIATVPTYPGAFWSWAYCTKEKGYGPFSQVNDELASVIEQSTRYYNRQIHRAAFALPNFVRERINPSSKILI